MDLADLEYKSTQKHTIVGFEGETYLDDKGNKQQIEFYSPDTEEYRRAQNQYRKNLILADDDPEAKIKALCTMLKEMTYKCHNVFFNKKKVTLKTLRKALIASAYLRGQCLIFVNDESNYIKAQKKS